MVCKTLDCQSRVYAVRYGTEKMHTGGKSVNKKAMLNFEICESKIRQKEKSRFWSGHTTHVLTCIAHALPVDFLKFCTVLSTKLLQIVHNLALVLEAYAKMFLQFPDPWFSTESAYKTLALSLAP